MKLGTTYNEKKKETFGETALELTENRMWALDLKNKGRGLTLNWPQRNSIFFLSFPALLVGRGRVGFGEFLKPVGTSRLCVLGQLLR